MIPLGTGLFKTMYDTDMHNKIIKEKNDEKILSEKSNNNNELENTREKENYLEMSKIGYEASQNIVEVKLKSSNKRIDAEEISSKLSFNLVDLIN